MDKKLQPMCARCAKLTCQPDTLLTNPLPALEDSPTNCPMKLHADVIKKATAEYDKPEVKEFARLASLQEFQCYEWINGQRRTKIPRVEELVQFSDKCGYHRLGIAHCGGLRYEARLLTDVLENKGFEVLTVSCKVGRTPKERIGIKPDEKIRGPERWESMCSPIAQAEIMNAEKVDLAVLLGLCLGHDTLFIKYCRVPMTVLAVKDRVTGHNPLAALYLTQSVYYGRLLAKREKSGDY